MSERQAVQQFIDQVRWLYEPEYGDFKRKMNLYIQRLEEAHPGVKRGEGEKVLSEIKTMVVYNPNGDIELTRREVLQLAAGLLGGNESTFH